MEKLLKWILNLRLDEMKSLLDMVEASGDDLPDIYCDMDQVLVDFLGGAEKVVGAPFAKSDNKTRWSKISGTKDFWANLDWMPGAKKLYQRVAKYDTRILSAFSGKDSNSKSGKTFFGPTSARSPRPGRRRSIGFARSRTIGSLTIPSGFAKRSGNTLIQNLG